MGSIPEGCGAGSGVFGATLDGHWWKWMEGETGREGKEMGVKRRGE